MENSNLKEKKQALLRAIVLVILLMGLTGLAVALFPASQYWQKITINGNYKHTLDTLNLIIQAERQLLADISKIEHHFDSITGLDQIWEIEKSANAKAVVKRDIKKLEEEMAGFVNQLKQTSGPLASKFVIAYNHLLASRELIWDLRSLDPGVVRENGYNEMENFQRKIDNAARELRDKADDIRVATDEIRKFLSKHHRTVRERLDDYVGDLKNLANKLEQN